MKEYWIVHSLITEYPMTEVRLTSYTNKPDDRFKEKFDAKDILNTKRRWIITPKFNELNDTFSEYEKSKD